MLSLVHVSQGGRPEHFDFLVLHATHATDVLVDFLLFDREDSGESICATLSLLLHVAEVLSAAEAMTKDCYLNCGMVD